MLVDDLIAELERINRVSPAFEYHDRPEGALRSCLAVRTRLIREAVDRLRKEGIQESPSAVSVHIS